MKKFLFLLLLGFVCLSSRAQHAPDALNTSLVSYQVSLTTQHSIFVPLQVWRSLPATNYRVKAQVSHNKIQIPHKMGG